MISSRDMLLPGTFEPFNDLGLLIEKYEKSVVGYKSLVLEGEIPISVYPCFVIKILFEGAFAFRSQIILQKSMVLRLHSELMGDVEECLKIPFKNIPLHIYCESNVLQRVLQRRLEIGI